MIEQRLSVAIVAVLFSFSWAHATSDPEAVFRELYGREAKGVAATATRKDDVALARKLIVAASEAKDSPAFQHLLYEKAYALGIQCQAGYASAIEAMEALIRVEPKLRCACDEKLLKAYNLQYRYCGRSERQAIGGLLLRHLLSMAGAELDAGEADESLAHYRQAHYLARKLKSSETRQIANKIKAAVARQKIDGEITRLGKLLASDRTNRRAAHRLVMLHLTERDDPNKAAELLPLAGPDQVLETYLPLLKKPWKHLSEQVALELATWYAKLAGEASPAGRPRMLARAKTYCGVYLGLHERDDAASLKAKNLLKRVEGELAEFGTTEMVLPAQAGPIAPPKGMSADLVVWTQRRDTLPAAEQVEAIRKKLSEINGGIEVEIDHHKIDAGRLVELSIDSEEKRLSIFPLFGLKLTKLSIDHGKVRNLDSLKGMPLKRFQANGMSLLRSLHGLEGLPLTELRLSHCESLVDVRALKGLPLRTLALQDGRILRDIRPLAGLKLDSLLLERSEGITDISPLKGMKLTFLHLGGCTCVRNIRIILDMPLTGLDLSSLPLRNLDPLRGLKLEILRVGNCKDLKDVSPMRGMPLRQVDLGGTNLRSFEVLKGMNLESLRLDSCKLIKDLSVLKDVSLISLGLNNTNVSSLAFMKGTKIKNLAVGGCRSLRSLDGLQGLPLRKLEIIRTSVRSLEPLRGIPLEELQMDDCRLVTSLEPLTGCPLRKLSVKGTRFATAAVEAEMKKKIPSLREFSRE